MADTKPSPSPKGANRYRVLVRDNDGVIYESCELDGDSPSAAKKVADDATSKAVKKSASDVVVKKIYETKAGSGRGKRIVSENVKVKNKK